MTTRQTKTITSADGTRIYALAGGDPSKPALICIHGFASTSFAFSKQFENPALLSKVFLVAYDIRGSGQSDKPVEAEAYDGARLAGDFKAVCDAFGIVRPVLLGWSLGGTAFNSVAGHLPPGYVRGVIYSGGAIPTRAIHADYASEWLKRILPELLSTDTTVMSRASIEFVDCLFARPERVPYEAKVRWLGEIMLAPPATRVRLEAGSRALNTTKWETAIKSMRLLVLQGREDCFAENDKIEKQLKERFGDQLQFVWIEGVGHMPFWEKTEEHDAVVVRYIESLGA
ncbi:uncharacterized protein PHACADRAFT_262679 [Phanerochaete carnosa HHB-10118-sp]|uniref:AB hydrolase-1 domain-containing protein n=1 Tax=Phanerochaete carnosa (strain HHB-10118-sp) TaxID=650164 RepID=K5VZA2_PHACS|nr:uncharacterized protein PHACADRAFT_262679 [Phanerochaete carnosa HHB-10118-sp]EKM52170.1 hypothetical protein PHACADRAFT_262679 [Phanerochaete carnosa HHB-10118-sp]